MLRSVWNSHLLKISTTVGVWGWDTPLGCAVDSRICVAVCIHFRSLSCGKRELLKWLETPFIWNFLLELCLVQFCNTVCALRLTGGLLLPAEQDAKFHTEVCFLLEFASPGNPKCKNVSSLSSVFALNVSKGKRCHSSQCWQQGPSSG